MLYFIKYENSVSHQALTYLQYPTLQSLPSTFHSTSPPKATSLLLLCLSFTPTFWTGNSRFCSHQIYEDERASTEVRYSLALIQKKAGSSTQRNPGTCGSPGKISARSVRANKSSGLMNVLELDRTGQIPSVS